jgi:hypothetical protein
MKKNGEGKTLAPVPGEGKDKVVPVLNYGRSVKLTSFPSIVGVQNGGGILLHTSLWRGA